MTLLSLGIDLIDGQQVVVKPHDVVWSEMGDVIQFEDIPRAFNVWEYIDIETEMTWTPRNVNEWETAEVQDFPGVLRIFRHAVVSLQLIRSDR